MKGKYRNKKKVLSSWNVITAVFFMVICLFFQSSWAQETGSVKVNQYWGVVTDHGGSQWLDLTSGWFPADFNVIANTAGTACSSHGNGLVLYATNWNGIPKAVFVPRSSMNPSGTVVEPLKNYIRYELPENVVNYKDAQGMAWSECNPEELIGTCDQFVEATNKYACDVVARRRVLAWSQQNHDNYIITDVVLENVGDDVLENFHVGMCQNTRSVSWANGHNPSPTGGETHSYKMNWFHYYGARVSEGDSQRVFYWYDADDPTSVGDDMGQPAVSQGGRLIKPTMYFYGFLHVSEEPYTDPVDDVNDPIQPTITYTGNGEMIGMAATDCYCNVDIDNEPWFETATGRLGENQPMDGTPTGTKHRVNMDEIGNPDFQAIGEGVAVGYSPAAAHSTIGPYTFRPGESIHIVWASGVAGLSLPVAKDVGEKLVNKTIEAPPNLPNPSTGYFPSNFQFPDGATEWDIKKDLWLSTGIDSVHKSIYRARWNYAHNYQVPAVPPPPNMSVTGYPEYAEIKWSCPDVENMENYAGYRVLRCVSNLDTAFFEVIYSTDEKAEEHIFEDTQIKLGASYYYYIQSAIRVADDDPNALPSQQGKKLWSGRLWLANPISIEPPHKSQDDLTKIRIVPNPYNINDPLLEEYGWPDFRGILFFNLPSKVIIKIFTENGDLIRTIKHDSPIQAGSLHWDMLTSSQQVISSGVYIAVFEDENGALSFQKFVVAR